LGKSGGGSQLLGTNSLQELNFWKMEEEEEINPSKGKRQKEDAWKRNISNNGATLMARRSARQCLWSTRPLRASTRWNMAVKPDEYRRAADQQ
jgi:hypothetical protein